MSFWYNYWLFFSKSVIQYNNSNNNEKTKKNISYQKIGMFIVIWIFLSFPITWIGGYYLTSNNYQKCPPTSLFTQYYTIDLSLCSSPP
ncbi:TPA: DUF1240 domain-containing protein [Morganella morganii]|nr:DUF1240 domain-containing protein [Vibrio vulnificus]HCE8948394.1 DUF1240 domain-containing protein [Morganella morganii]